MLAVCGHSEWIDGNTACAYAACVSIDGESHWVWGYGYAKNTDAFYVHGVLAAYDVLRANSSDERPTMQIFAFAIGFISNVRNFVSGWKANGGRTRDRHIPEAYEQYLRVSELDEVSKLSVHRVTPKRTFPENRVAKHLARQLCNVAHFERNGLQLGLTKSGVGMPRLSE